MRRALASVLAVTIGAAVASAQARPDLVERLSSLTRESVWTRAAATALAFPAHHPQGLVKIGDTFFLSAVEIKTRTRRFPEPVGGFDRDAGEGVGHLFKFDAAASCSRRSRWARARSITPAASTYDGARHLGSGRGIPAEQPVDRLPRRSATMKATEVLRVADHIGGIVHDREDARSTASAGARGGSIAGSSTPAGRVANVVDDRRRCAA